MNIKVLLSQIKDLLVAVVSRERIQEITYTFLLYTLSREPCLWKTGREINFAEQPLNNPYFPCVCLMK